MATTLTPTLKFTITGSRANTVDLESAAVTLSATIQKAFTNGTGDGQVDMCWSDTRTVLTGANDDIDLAGALTDVFGATLTFSKVKAIVIYSKSDDNKVLSVGGDGANGFTSWLNAATDKVKVNPGGWLVLVAPNAGYNVTAGTGDILRVTNAAGASSTYDIWVFGTSA